MLGGYTLRVGPAGSTAFCSDALLVEAALIGLGWVGWCSRFSRAKARACCCKSSIPRRKSASEPRLHSGASSRATSRASMRSRIPSGTPFGCRSASAANLSAQKRVKMTNRGAGVSGHANGHDRRDRVHQVLKRFDRHGAICRYFLDCFVQFWTSILQINRRRKVVGFASGFVGQLRSRRSTISSQERSAAAFVGSRG